MIVFMNFCPFLCGFDKQKCPIQGTQEITITTALALNTGYTMAN